MSLQTVVASLLLPVLPTSLTELGSVLSLDIGPTFILIFFVADQAVCLYCYICTPSSQFSTRRILTHVVWGFLNTKVEYINTTVRGVHNSWLMSNALLEIKNPSI